MPELKIDIKVDDGDAKRKLKDLGDTMDKAGKTGKKGIDEASGSLSGLKKQSDNATNGLDGLKKKFDTASASAEAFKGILGAAGVLGALHLVGEGFTYAIKTGANFEQQMATVGGVMRASQADMAKLTAVAREMGATTEWSATQSAEALQYLGMAGFNATDAVKALPGMLDLATAGQLDLGKAADIATDGLTAMGMSVDQLSHFNDVLVGTITRSNTDIEKMGYSLKYVAPVASQLGYDIEQVSAAIGVMANAGLKGEMAGTGLSAVYLKLDKATKELGISSNKLPDVMQAIADKQWNATKVAEVFGAEHVKTVMVLKSGMPAYHDLEKTLRNVDGEASTLATTMRGTVQGSFKTLASTVESFGIDVFEEYKDTVRQSTDAMSQFIRDWGSTVISTMNIVSGTIRQTINLFDQLKMTPSKMAEIHRESTTAWQNIFDVVSGKRTVGTGSLKGEAADMFGLEQAAKRSIQAMKDVEVTAAQTHDKLKKESEARLAAETGIIATRKAAEDEMYKSLGAKAEGYREREIAKITEQKEIYADASGNRVLAEQWAAAEIDKINQNIVKGHSKAATEHEKLIKKQAKIEAQANQDREQSYDKMYSDLGDKADGWKNYELANLKKQQVEFEKATGDKKLAYAWYVDQVKKLEDEITKKVKDEEEARKKEAEAKLEERATAYDRMYTILGTQADGYRAHEISKLEEERTAFEKATGDKELAHATFANQVKALDQSIADEAKKRAAENIGSWEWFEAEASKSMDAIYENGRSALSDGLFDLLKGDIESFSDLWQSFWDDMLRIFTDTVAKMTIAWATQGIQNWLFPTNAFASGGSIGGVGSGSTAGGGILGSLGSTAIGEGARYVWDSAKGWITGGSAAAIGSSYLGSSAIASDIYLGTGALVDMGSLAGASAGSGIMGSIGALMTNPWTWGIGAALLGGGLIAKNSMQPEKRQSIDDTDFNFFDQINLNSSALNGGGDPMYTELANEAARAAQRDVVRMMDAFMETIPSQLRDGFRESLSKMSVHLGGGGMQIREDHLGEDTQVMYQGTLYAMFVDTFDPMIQMMEKMQSQYGIDSSAFIAEGKKLQQDFFNFDPEGFWTGEYQTLFNSYYDWFGRVQEYLAGLTNQIDTAVAAQEATIKASLTMADIVKGSDKEYRDIFAEYDKLFRDLGATTEGYREWETAKLQKEMQEMAEITGNQVLAQRWYGEQLEDLYEKIAEAHQKQYAASEQIASSTEQIANIVDRQLAEAAQVATAAVKPNAPNGYSYATYGLQTGGLTFAELTERKKALWGHGYGYAAGGVIDRLIVPRGEDGYAAVQYGEGVVSKDGMKALEAINAGLIKGGSRPINITIPIDIGGDIKTYVVKVADDHRVKVSSRPGMERRRAVR